MNKEQDYYDYFILLTSRGGGKTRFYTRQHNPLYYKQDPCDMDILEEIKEDYE